MDGTSKNSTHNVHIGKTKFEIPSHMTLADSAECWQADSEALSVIIRAIVDNRRLAHLVLHEICQKYHYYLKPYDPALADEKPVVEVGEPRPVEV